MPEYLKNDKKMKNILKMVFAVALICLTAACRDNGREGKVVSQGSPYEIIVVCSQDKWEGPLGDTIRAALNEPVKMINNAEPMYTVLRVMPNAFDGLIAKHRNILYIDTGAEYSEPRMLAEYNLYSAPQIIVKVIGPDTRTLTQYVAEHTYELQTVFEIAERDRAVALNQRYGEKSVADAVERQFGFEMKFTKGFSVRNSIADKNFLWISNEHPLASQGVVIYSYPYSGTSDFTVDSLVAARDRFVALIPGENPGSHMVTADVIEPVVKHMRIRGRVWTEMRGFWDVKGDFMGGPFVSYSTIDKENARVVVIDLYLYSPDKPKRNYLRQLEHLVYGVKFPSDAQDEKEE